MLMYLGIALTILILSSRLLRRRQYLPLPPGPPRLPLLGNVLDLLSAVEPWKAFAGWSEQYDSDIIYLNLAGTSTLVLNTYKTATELLERRSSLYSSRPPLPLVTEFGGWDFAISTMPYGPQWREHRALLHRSFHAQAAQQFQPYLMKSVAVMLKSLAESPQNFIEHLRLMVAGSTLSLTYGIEVTSGHHSYIEMAEKAVAGAEDPRVIGQGVLGFLPVPLIRLIPSWLPGAGAKRAAEIWAKDTWTFLNTTMEDAVNMYMEAGQSKRSFVSEALGAKKEHQSEEEHYTTVRNVAGMIYGAGFDTTLSTLQTFLLTMALHPEAQRKAHEELDRALGSALPSFDNMNSCPYTTAVIMELMRWRPVVPIGVSHFIDVEDEYMGYRIPAGTTVIANATAMMHNEVVYPDPDTFMPERFLTPDGEIDHSVPDPRLVVFGHGRRICPGRHFAEYSLWITIASILAVYDISHPTTEDGTPLTATTAEFRCGITLCPKPFKCTITPRSDKARQRLRLLDLDNP